MTEETEVRDCVVKVTYVHPDTLSSKSFTEKVDRDELKQFFKDTCTHFASFVHAVMQRIELRKQTGIEARDTVHNSCGRTEKLSPSRLYVNSGSRRSHV